MKLRQQGISPVPRAARALAAAFAIWAAIPACGQSANPNIASYFEFGTVVALGQRNIDIQLYDERKQRVVQHSFVLGRDARADVVHVGDTVEIIYNPGVDWTVRRVVLLTSGIPKAGPPTDGAREVPAVADARLPQPATGSKVPTAIDARLPQPATGSKVPAATSARLPQPVAGSKAPAATVDAAVSHGTPAAAKIPAATSTPLKGGHTSSAAASTARDVVIPAPAPGAKSAATASAVDLGNASKPKATNLIDVPLGAGEASLPKAPTAMTIAREMPAEECNRSSVDWPAQPLRLAVLDFRYPTEREESHDVGTTGGGSGTAVADLVYARLDQLNEFAMSRGDRTRLYRADFAGAARIGRELGVDAVLAGTFAPVDPPPGSDPDFPPPKTYELRAGIVDTCTGQLLMRLTSVACTDGLDPNSSINAASCKRFSVTAKQAMDPKDAVGAFRVPLDALLYPLEHNGPPPGAQGSAGIVTASDNGAVTIKLPTGSQLKPGDQVALHAYRLTKNPTTYTLHNLHDEEIGRLTIKSVRGGTAIGSFLGDFPPHPGDTAELIPE
jgi:hypothetical protein